jgi:hypothetical protein
MEILNVLFVVFVTDQLELILGRIMLGSVTEFVSQTRIGLNLKKRRWRLCRGAEHGGHCTSAPTTHAALRRG